MSRVIILKRFAPIHQRNSQVNPFTRYYEQLRNVQISFAAVAPQHSYCSNDIFPSSSWKNVASEHDHWKMFFNSWTRGAVYFSFAEFEKNTPQSFHKMLQSKKTFLRYCLIFFVYWFPVFGWHRRRRKIRNKDCDDPSFCYVGLNFGMLERWQNCPKKCFSTASSDPRDRDRTRSSYEWHNSYVLNFLTYTCRSSRLFSSGSLPSLRQGPQRSENIDICYLRYCTTLRFQDSYELRTLTLSRGNEVANDYIFLSRKLNFLKLPSIS